MGPDEIAKMIERGTQMLQKHFVDFSDADMLVRPVPNANHAAWQMAHLANSQIMATKAVAPEAVISVPANFAESHTKEAAASDDPARFPNKATVLKILEDVKNAQVSALKKMTNEDLAKPGPEKARGYADTIGQLLLMGPMHSAMHAGQIQVIRRKLGKPVLF